MKNDTASVLSAAVDRLAAVKAEVEALRQEEDALKKLLADSGEQLILGVAYRASVSQQQRDTTDWKGIAMKLGASRQMIVANTTTGDPYYVVKLSAHKGA